VVRSRCASLSRLTHAQGAVAFARSFCAWIAFATVCARLATAASVGGDIAVTNDYIYRGMSESGGKAALQLDLHASTRRGDFAGIWGSTRDHNLEPGADYDVAVYVGHRFDLSSAWNATLTALNYSYVGGEQELSNDYQELSASLGYLDRWTFSVSAVPNAVRYYMYRRIGRYDAFVADTTGQWGLVDGFFVTGGVGYYYFAGSGRWRGTGYTYGNVGLAFERHGWRLDVGYFFTQQHAEQIFPYPSADNRVAGTLSWHF
jgi:uncharacterized protein (TIGR02001 family)